MKSGATKTRGAIAPGKKQVNWRLREDLLDKLESERLEKRFKSIPAFLEFLLSNRYYPDERNPPIFSEKGDR